MESPPPPASQASSHFPLEPIPASVLADKEARRRDEVLKLGACKTGCVRLDDEVLVGGFERGSVAGISAEDEEMGLGLQTLAHSLCDGRVKSGLVVTPKPASVMLAGLRDAVKAELKEDARKGTRECLERVMLSCVFDLDGLWEVLSDLDRAEETEEDDPERQDAVSVQEIQDSQDDDDDALSPIQEPPSQRQTKTTHPDMIVITHFSSLLTSLFTHREKSAAHSALQLLGSHLRDLTRNLASHPLILILNSTSSPAAKQTPAPAPAPD
ncbi:hypothetical protein FZEAL_10582, partial [Fusarium zealandicum]